MSDPCAQLRPALKAMLRADAGVLAAFGMSPVQVVDFPGPNLKVPYVIIGEAGATPELAECIDGAEADVTLHVFSRMQPPAFTEAAAIAAAITAAILGAPLDLAAHAVANVEPVSARYLTDADTVTAHAVLIFRFNTEAI